MSAHDVSPCRCIEPIDGLVTEGDGFCLRCGHRITPKAKAKTIWNVADKQGWTSGTVLALALDYIELIGSTDVFVEYAQGRADVENTEAATP